VYGTEVIDLDLLTQKLSGVSTEPSVPEPYISPPHLPGITERIAAFGIYGRDVQDADDETIPDDVKEKILRFVKAGLAVSFMKCKSYFQWVLLQWE
jgi:L-fucose isomerase